VGTTVAALLAPAAADRNPWQNSQQQ